MFWRFRLVYRRIKRFIVWFPVIWNDEDWDESYLFTIMEFKISQMRKETQRCARHVGWEKDVRDMKIAEELLRRASGKCDYLKDWAELCECKDENFSSSRFVGKNGEWISPFCEHCQKFGLDKCHKKEEFDFQYLMNHLRKNVRKWWS